MVKFQNSLQTKITLNFVLLIAVISSSAYFMTYGTTREALMEQLRSELRSAASALASQVDPEVQARLSPGDEAKPEYQAIRSQLERAKTANSNIKFVYTMRQTGAGVQFVIDADYGVKPDGCRIGQPYTQGPNTKDLMEGFEQPSADQKFTKDEWGVVLSGYAPIRHASGESVGLLGVDMDSKEVERRLNSIAFSNFYIIVLAIILATVIILTFSYTIIRDINRVVASANAAIDGQAGQGLAVKRRDEIGELAEAFKKLQAKLVERPPAQEPPNPPDEEQPPTDP